jgi:glycosyltransferase involved in cell wall biosynthesis
MGHDIALLSGDYPRDKVGSDDNPVVPRWRRMERKLLQWQVFQPFRGELSILGAFRHEIYVFFSALITILRRKRRFDIIYRRHNLFNSEYLLAKLFRIPSVREVNGIVADEAKITRSGDRVSLWIIDRIERFNISKADKMIVVTPKLKELLHSEYGIKSDRITVVQNGANTDLFRPMDVIKVRDELNLRQDCSYICFVGILVQWQGIEYVIRSMPLVLSECPQTQLIIVGDGQMKQELMSLADQVGVLNNMIFTGMVPYQKVPLYVNASDVCVAPKVGLRSGYSPLKLCEYMACGKPVVASRASGLEILEDSQGGILVEPGNSLELGTAITRLLQDKELRKQMGENGRRYVLQNLSWESVARRVAEVLSDAMRTGSKES